MPKSQQIEVASVETLTLWKIDDQYYTSSGTSLSNPITPKHALEFFVLMLRIQEYACCDTSESPFALADLIEAVVGK